MAIPRKDSELAAYSLNFATRTTATPLVFAMTAAEAAAFEALSEPFIEAWNAVNTDGAKSKALVAAKNAKRAALLPLARALYARIQSSLDVSDENKTLLQIKIRKTEPTPIPAPAVVPAVTVLNVYGNLMRVGIRDASGVRRGRPYGCAGATLFCFIGENPPTSTQTWQALGNVTKNQILVPLPPETPPNTKVYFCAYWYTVRGLSGPTSTPIFAYTTHEGAAPAEA